MIVQAIKAMNEDFSCRLSAVDAIVEDARLGRPTIIIDDLSEDSVGHLFVPAAKAGSDMINFMATEARGLICLALDSETVERLQLQMMPRNDLSVRDAFTISIEAREGVTTGISAFDRARTIAVAIDPNTQPQDLVSPGHVFPIVPRKGGVLFNPGHSEAAMDLSRMAGYGSAAVICQLLNEQGDVSRLNELMDFSARHGVKVGAVSDLVAHRRRAEKLVERVATAPLASRYCGDVTIHVYRDTVDKGEHVALVKGDVTPGAETLVRVHQVDIATDLLGWSAGRQDYVVRALKAMQAYDGPAVAVFVHDPSPTSIADRVNGMRHEYMMKNAVRDYGIGAQILIDLDVQDMVLLTSSARKLAALEGFGLKIIRRQEI